MCAACAELETAVAIEPDADIDLPDMETLKRIHLRRQRALRDSVPICPHCEWDFHPSERGDFWPELCASCETNALEDLVRDLISPRRKVRRKAERAVKRLRKALT